MLKVTVQPLIQFCPKKESFAELNDIRRYLEATCLWREHYETSKELV
jgi:hypothetical protein